MKPLISVIIPTANRPHFLARAISSALEGLALEDIEVIVVPNGPDKSWRQSEERFKGNLSVRFIPIEKANANIARNIGLKNSSGALVRFLDDDDYLNPVEAVQQYEMLQSSTADIISGSLEIVNSQGVRIRCWPQPKMSDFCSAVFISSRCCQPTAHVFRRKLIEGLEWNPATVIGQDIEWMITICLNRDVKWITTSNIVGVWVHHSGTRTSILKNRYETNKINVEVLMQAYNILLERGQANAQRKRALAEGVWGRVHAAYFLKPSYWEDVARFATRVDEKVRPPQALYNFYFFRKLSPLSILKVLKIKHELWFKVGLFLKNRLR